ncbi:MAG: phosphoribosyltransferase family protein [Bacteroidia bacterium]|nr:phosphoribosyltransferase family protein [Bacteroidia bacterium]
MALEILERHYGEMLPVLIPASERGTSLTRHLHWILEKEGAFPQRMSEVSPGSASILLVDDVICTGATLLKRLLELWKTMSPPQVEVLVLVDRGHRRFPIAADYVGVRLATTLQEYVEVVHLPRGWEVWLR